MFPPAGIPLSGQLLLVTDQLPSPANFLLLKLFTDHLKHVPGLGKHPKCVVLSALEDLARWRSVASKSGLNIDQHLSSNTVVFFNFQARSLDATLRPFLDLVRTELQKDNDRPLLVILDDVSALEWIGLSTLEISRFLRALSALCRRVEAALVVRHHIITPGDPDELFRHLLQLASHHVEVRPLSSGRSGTVSGEIAFHTHACSTSMAQVKATPRSAAIQYRLTDGGATFFNKGTSVGVL